MARRRIVLKNHAPFGLLYAALIGGLVLFIGGFFLCWILSISMVRTSPRTFTTVATVSPATYVFAYATLGIGLLLCASIFVYCAFRWVRGARFSLAELICMVLVLGIALCFVVNNCVNRTWQEPSITSWLVVSVISPFFSVANYDKWREGVNFGIYAGELLIWLLFAIPLFGRLPQGHRIARYGLLGLLILSAIGFEHAMLAHAAGAVSLGGILLYGVTNLDATAALFSSNKTPGLPVPAVAADKSSAAARAGV